MTIVNRAERYETNACMDRQDAEQMGVHLLALAPVLATCGGMLAVNDCDYQTCLHYSRLMRILQRATQPDVVGRAACSGVERITLDIENGYRIFTIRTQRADIVIDAERSYIRVDGPVGKVVQMNQYGNRRRA